jgi:hypothetical protein
VSSPEPPTGAQPDPANEWFWTGVPAGFILGVVGILLWVLLGFWIGLVIVLAVVAVGARIAIRDGQESLQKYLLGTAVLLVPAAIVYLAFIRSLVHG